MTAGHFPLGSVGLITCSTSDWAASNQTTRFLLLTWAMYAPVMDVPSRVWWCHRAPNLATPGYRWRVQQRGARSWPGALSVRCAHTPCAQVVDDPHRSLFWLPQAAGGGCAPAAQGRAQLGGRHHGRDAYPDLPDRCAAGAPPQLLPKPCKRLGLLAEPAVALRLTKPRMHAVSILVLALSASTEQAQGLQCCMGQHESHMLQ